MECRRKVSDCKACLPNYTCARKAHEPAYVRRSYGKLKEYEEGYDSIVKLSAHGAGLPG